MEIKKGLSGKNIRQLIEYANDDGEVKRFTSDAKRFKNRKSYNEWLKKGRTIYRLIDEADNLLGITWFGMDGDGGFTLAIRIYEKARGKGLGYWFLKETMTSFMKEGEYKEAENKNWWLETSEDNLPAIKIYEKLGFKLSEKGSEPGKVIYHHHHGFGF